MSCTWSKRWSCKICWASAASERVGSAARQLCSNMTALPVNIRRRKVENGFIFLILDESFKLICRFSGFARSSRFTNQSKFRFNFFKTAPLGFFDDQPHENKSHGARHAK